MLSEKDVCCASASIIKLLVEENSKLRSENDSLKSRLEKCERCDSYECDYSCNHCGDYYCYDHWREGCQNRNHDTDRCLNCDIRNNNSYCSNCSKTFSECGSCFKRSELHCIDCKKSYCYNCLKAKSLCGNNHNKCNDCLNNGTEVKKREECGCFSCDHCIKFETCCSVFEVED